MTSRPVHFRINDVVIRRAKHSDYQAVMDIDDNIYDGLDYMPLMFHQFLQSRHHVVLIVEAEGEIIGLVNYHFSDDEPHVMTSMSGRLKSSRRGTGVFDRKQVAQKIVQLFPQLTDQMFVTLTRFVRPETVTKLYRWVSLSFRLSAQLMPTRLAEFRSSTVSCDVLSPKPPRPLSYEMVNTLLTSGDHLERFFDRYCVGHIPAQWHWRPMKIDKRHLKELFATASWALVTDDMDDGDVDSLSTTTRVRTIRAISYSYVFPVKLGISCVTFFFSDDPQVAARHAIGHAEHLASVWNGNVGFWFHVPENLNIDQINTAVQSVLGSYTNSMSVFMGNRRLPVPESKL